MELLMETQAIMGKVLITKVTIVRDLIISQHFFSILNNNIFLFPNLMVIMLWMYHKIKPIMVNL
jgi:hypothetical protein